MLVKLTQMYFDARGFRHRAGTVIDLPAERVPKSAVPVGEGAEVPEAVFKDGVAEPTGPVLRSVYRGNPRRPEAARWRLMVGDRVLEEFTDKAACEVARLDLERDPEMLRERLGEGE